MAKTENYKYTIEEAFKSCSYPSWMEHGVITADIIRLRPDTKNMDARRLEAALNSDSFKR